MKGYRTLIFNAIAVVAGLLGLHLTMDNVNTWVDLFVALVPVGNIVLRMVTNTAFGQKVAQEIASVGLHPDTIAQLAGAIAAALPPPPIQGDASAVPVQPPAIDLGAVAGALGQALEAMQQAHAAVSAAVQPNPSAAAPVAAIAGGANA